MKKLIVILGPTCTGKSQTAIHLAKKFTGEVVNADSRQVYKELKIGASKPLTEEYGEIPHHLFDTCELECQLNAADFRRAADSIIEKIVQKNHLPILVGGTGLYIKSVLFGFFEGPQADVDMRLRLEKRIRNEGTTKLHEELTRIDPEASKRIHPNDPTRIIRALEVFELTGKPISEHQAAHGFEKPRYDYLKIGLNKKRDELYDSINKRVLSMIESGLEEEVLLLYKKWKNNPILTKAIGYKEWYPYFKGEINKNEVIKNIQQNTRHLAKRQLTWFKKEKDIKWFEIGDEEGIEKEVVRFS